jgi:hypothetical protein
MFLHIGKDVLIPMENIIAIVDVDSCLASEDAMNYIKNAEEKGQLCNTNNKKIRSYVITNTGKKDIIYTSSISSSTLYKRNEISNDIVSL